jgi:hypothetical protein
MLSSIAMDQRWTAAMKDEQVRIRSSFCSSLKSFGTHLADFFSSPKSL